jgi:Ni/Co efflux regulator RcnB
MNTFIKAAILSIATALISLPALAAPQEQHQQHQAAQSHEHAQKHPSNGHQQPTQATIKKAKHPSQDWKAGQKLPSAYHSNAYKVDHQKYTKLSKPGKNQQWIKVNGDYVLTDIRNHSIIKIIAG